MGDDRPPVYFDPDVDRWVYRASSLGRCERELVLWRRGQVGTPTPEWLQVRFDEGHEYEDEILSRYEAKRPGTELIDRQGHAQIAVGKSAMVRGSIDGFDEARNTVVDAKFLGPDLYRKLQRGIEAMEEYRWQQAVYAHGLGAQSICLAMGLKDIEGQGDDRKVLGVADYSEMWISIDDLPTVAQIKARVMRLEKLAAKADELPDCPKGGQYPCPFEHFHDEKPEDDYIEVEGTNAALIRRAQSLNAKARRAEKDAKALKAEAKEIVAKVLADLGLDAGAKQKVAAGAVRVTWVHEEVAATTREVKAHTRTYPKFTDKTGAAA